MIFFPKAKINLGLNIIRKRPDGYHDLETVFYPIPLRDSLEWLEKKDTRIKVYFHEKGRIERLPELEGENNLVLKAYALLKRDFKLPSLEFLMIKNIPTGAGLGGGSSDAAYTLTELNKSYNLGLNTLQLQAYASQLGSDCAFFIESKPALARGRGEVLKTIPLSLKSRFLVLVKPPFSISTREAYSGLIPKIPSYSLEDTFQKPINFWQEEMVNDFEASLFVQYPHLIKVKNELLRHGALYASLSGSGSALYGIFEERVSCPELEMENQVFYLTL
jgi:4-diphosphocytidyl-2-C-methyl-D-erythritol kinase